MPTKKAPKSRKKGLKKVALKPIKTLVTFGTIKGDATTEGFQHWINISSQ